MNVSGQDVNRLIGRMSGVIVVVLVAILPVVYFVIGWESQNTHLRMEAEVYARDVSAVIARNPDMWRYEVDRLERILSTQPGGEHLSRYRILGSDGSVLARREGVLPWPVMTRSHPLRDAGEVVGAVEASASLRVLLTETAALTLIGAVLGLALFLLLRKYPISALRNALDQLSRERERAHVTLDSIEEGVISVDAEGRIALLNRAGENMTGWRLPDAAGKPLGDVFRCEEGVLAGKDGSRRLVESATSPLLDGDGRAFGTVLVFRDVTAKAAAEAELHKAQKLESLGILAAGIAHEIRNPLSAINISISSIDYVCGKSEGLEPESGEKVRLIVEQMKSAAAKMASVVQRVMEFSKPAPPRKEMACMNEAVEEAIRLSSSTLRKREIEVVKALAADLPPCRADVRLIEQVLINLIANACQAMEGMEGSKRLEIASSVRDGRIVLRVSDSGPGVPPSLRGKIFDPFFTTRKDGSGIGLSFSHRIVADHGGKLAVDTSRWGGAEFRIELPAAETSFA